MNVTEKKLDAEASRNKYNYTSYRTTILHAHPLHLFFLYLQFPLCVTMWQATMAWESHKKNHDPSQVSKFKLEFDDTQIITDSAPCHDERHDELLHGRTSSRPLERDGGVRHQTGSAVIKGSAPKTACRTDVAATPLKKKKQVPLLPPSQENL